MTFLLQWCPKYSDRLLDYFHLYKDTKDTCVNQLDESGSVVEFSFVCFVFFFLFCFVPVSLYVSQAFLLHKLVAIILPQFSTCWNCRCNHRAWLNWSSLHLYCIRDWCSAPFPMSFLHEKLKPHWRFESGVRTQSSQKLDVGATGASHWDRGMGVGLCLCGCLTPAILFALRWFSIVIWFDYY